MNEKYGQKEIPFPDMDENFNEQPMAINKFSQQLNGLLSVPPVPKKQ
jgi:hypothetical protein